MHEYLHSYLEMRRLDNLHSSALEHKCMVKKVAIYPREAAKSDSDTDA